MHMLPCNDPATVLSGIMAVLAVGPPGRHGRPGRWAAGSSWPLETTGLVVAVLAFGLPGRHGRLPSCLTCCSPQDQDCLSCTCWATVSRRSKWEPLANLSPFPRMAYKHAEIEWVGRTLESKSPGWVAKHRKMEETLWTQDFLKI